MVTNQDPIVTTTRNDYDEYIRVRDTEWTYYNLYKVINQIDIPVFPEADTDKQNLCIEWDELMSNKVISPYMYQWVKGRINEANITSYLLSVFGDKWQRLYDIMTEEYNALQPYHIHEEEHTDDIKDESKTGESESTSDNTGESSNTSSTTNDGSRYGFNSSSAVNVDKQEDEVEASADYSDDLHNVTTTGNTYTTDNDLDRTLDRDGNIGNTTMSQLVDMEWETRKKLLLEQVRIDITDTLTIPVYLCDL